jgi:ATP-dependent NAD(P)H-hydrate dehydratase
MSGRLVLISSPVLICDAEGGLKRMGGQGDILSGVIATFLAWGKGYQDGVWK